MNSMLEHPLIAHGAFGTAVQHHRAPSNAAQPNQSSPGCARLVMGQADLQELQRMASTCGTPLVAAFLCGRYLVVTPRFEAGRPCARCFVRRFLSSPPPGLDSEAVLALSTLAGIESGFDPTAFAPSLVPLACALLDRQADGHGRHALLVDQAGLRHTHAPLVAVHGCACRGPGTGHARFTDFHSEMFR